MSFITQGKTNLKYILIVVILAAIAGGGILGYNVLKKENNLVYDSEIGEEVYTNSLLIFGDKEEIEEAIKQFDGEIVLSSLDTHMVEFKTSGLPDLMVIKGQLENRGFVTQKVRKSEPALQAIE